MAMFLARNKEEAFQMLVEEHAYKNDDGSYDTNWMYPFDNLTPDDMIELNLTGPCYVAGYVE
jgi:hypothetical protein